MGEKLRHGLLIILVAWLPRAAAADDPSVAKAAPPPAGAAEKEPAPPTIESIHVLRDGVPKPSLEFEIGDSVAVKLAEGGLALLQKQAALKSKKLGLFLDAHFMAGVPPLVLGKDELRFGPIRNDTNKDFWTDLWGERLFDVRQLTVGVGLDDASFVSTAPLSLSSPPLRGWKFFLLLLGAIALLALTVGLAYRTGMIRDGAVIRDQEGKMTFAPTYSLGRSQMAFWFVNVVLAVLVIWAVTGSVAPITTSVLGLLGIGAGTALGAALVDQSSNGGAPKPSVSFIKDILTDGGTIAIHRFQMLVWTVVLFFVFWGAVYSRLALPDFDSTMLALMGISAGAYVGFKFPENQKPAVAAPPPT